MAQKGENYTVVVSDEDSFDAVLPVRTVRYIYVRGPTPPDAPATGRRPLLHPLPVARPTCCMPASPASLGVSMRSGWSSASVLVYVCLLMKACFFHP